MPVNLLPNEPSMPDDLVRQLFKQVQLGMAEHARPSLAEVYFPSAVDSEFLENGTGAVVEIDGKRLLLSNAHVLKENQLTYGFFDSDDFIKATTLKYCIEEPCDLGAAQVPDSVWERHSAGGRAVPMDRFADRHQTVPFEILWTAGFPGARVKQFSNLVLSVCQALPTQEYLFHEDGEVPHEKFNPAFHFAVGYSPDQSQSIDDALMSTSPGLSDPHGLSGSLVWNSRRLECFYRNEPWDPTKAVVTGIVWGWPKSNYLIATRVEHIRPFLLEVVARINCESPEDADSPQQP